MKKSLFFAFFAFFASLILTACNSNSNENNASSTTKTSVTVKVVPISMSDEGNSFLVKDSLGKNKIPKNPSKVVILDLGILDTFDALELNDKVAGVPAKNLPKYLQQFKNKPNVGGVQQVDFEAINALKPDLIIISGRQSKFYDKLKEIAPTLFVGLDSANFLSSFENNVLSVAKLYGLEKEASVKIADIKNEIEKAKSIVDEDKKALIILTNSNKISAFGPQSRFGIIHDVLGINAIDENIKVGTHGKSINSEFILEKNPDYIFVIDRNVIVGNKERAQGILDNPLVAKTKAAQNKKIIYLDPEYWYLANGNGLESLKTMILEIKNAVK
ncbi:TPA: siderophore ABC transporter substrate-binding protein [Campylobacter jejuni]|nr:siderophore ABC transporter substrate-binding protein [Campylobacter jejuni]HDZ5084403.1 siderophore ABC transporter substrate-binding protein [Campylobacter jejuni]HDZ5087536.1 siderophore ABC transporter substrate-binding protein [Campylobacter jejuni]HDZ5090751.1 siderophore ABC transporter substrate-binding protein [Campylobacter jejuni]HDZ5092565.1 siderophore ABC transporter substrate-binding protein [Campylobacter jejuni]